MRDPLAWDTGPAQLIAACKAGHAGYMAPGSTTAAVCLIGNGALMDACNMQAGWAACSQNPLPAAVCHAYPYGFAAAYVPGRDSAAPPTSTTTCAWAGGGGSDYYYVYGCGKTIGTATYQSTPVNCSGFDTAIATRTATFMPPNPWRPNTTLPLKDQDVGVIQSDEVTAATLCCHP